MTDIVERLRMDYFEFKGHALLREAANEIERLRRELIHERIYTGKPDQMALEEAARVAETHEWDPDVKGTVNKQIAAAIRALKGGE